MAQAKRAGGRLDDAARAGWLYYIGGKTQDEIAAAMGISRQAAQRLVSLAVSERLVRVWLDHPIARCMELGDALKARFGLRQAEIVPSDPGETEGTTGLGEAGAREITRWLRRPEPTVIAIGTGRTLKAAVDRLPPIACPQHRIVSLTGAVGPDGSAAYYNVIFSMAEAVEARHFPMPLPVYVAGREERELLHGQAMIASTLALAARADVAFVGIGGMDDRAPLRLDGFLSEAELAEARARGAAGEICGWVYGADGRLLDGAPNDRTASAPLPDRRSACVFALAKGVRKLPAIRGALAGGLVNALITDERTAEALLG